MKNFFMNLRRYKIKSPDNKVLNRLIGFVERADFTKSKTSKFICSHYGVGSQDLLMLWNKLYEKKKNYNTLRSQISNLSRQLYDMFGGYDMVVNAFENNDEEAMLYISGVIDALELNNDMVFSDIFIDEVVAFTNHGGKISSFSVSDCEKEIGVLRQLKKARVKDMLAELNVEKLQYIQQLLNTSIFTGVNSSLNTEKLELLKKLS